MAFQTEETLWTQMLSCLEKVLEPHVCEHWFSFVTFKSFDGNRLVLTVPNEFFLSWFRERYGEVLGVVARQVLQRDITIDFLVRPEERRKQPPRDGMTLDLDIQEKRVEKRDNVSHNTVRLNPRYTFENFVVGHGNEFAYAAAKAVSESPGKNYNPLFIYGMTGLGKTHLMQGIGHQLLRKDASKKVMYVTSEEFTNELIMSITEGSQSKFRGKYRKVDVLLIDDIHFIAEKEATQVEFFHTFNELFDQHKQIVLSSDRSPKEIRGVESRLVSRFEWGLVTDIQPPDFETRVAILRSKLIQKGYELEDEILEYIARSVTSNVRQLEGALTGVIALMKLRGKDRITLEQAEQVVRDIEDRTRTQCITPESVLRAVAETFDVRLVDLKGRCRKKQYVLPRQVGMYLCRLLIPSMSLSYIGELFGGKDHTTVLHSCERVEQELQKKGETWKAVESLLKKLKGE
ncbi:MAG TPA: chromosomal replication initiator protein DnaA [Candidatus Hydrogenedens sp.]|nr:chromosomal replication initiator protein DnaA [Candidatus Hydrogenedens sp.]HOK09338.1 chromosomal replication initiator protein DnaA [Candidatus Hydrogenedens sp.]HPP58592.1 chromosomal replication initiator protein DnaA [Candidatus Hydrogenedens sp.]